MLSIFILASASYSWPIEDSYYPLNNGWNGCSKLFQLASNGFILHSYSEPLPNGTSLLAIVGPKIVFDRSESVKIHGFLDSGGIVLLADDYGTGNSLLENLNVSVRFSGKPLADLYFYSKQSVFPLVSDFMPNPISSNLTTIMMAYPSYVEVQDGRQVNVLARSSPFSFIDTSRTGMLPPNEITQSYPVMATAHVGNGMLVLVANARMLTNDMIGLFNNTVLVRNLLRTAEWTMTFDVAHLSRAPLTDQRIALKTSINIALATLQSTVLRVAITVALILIFSTAFLRQIRAGHRSNHSQARMESSLHIEVPT